MSQEMQIEKINDNSEVTVNSVQIAMLKKSFPQVFDKDGNFIAERMNEIMGENGVDLSSESYSLTWLGKSYARLLANENPLTLIKENKEHNAKDENKNSQNILIKGDNLEVLKHLKNAYRESIKMIYIDPPYNTGGDGFLYDDDRTFTEEELSKLAGIEIEEAKRILKFTNSKSNSHSAWLTFMYPRLYVARELLKDDGMIFISIDDNEASQLKLLCDDVFGEENFITNIVWEKKTGASDAGTISTITEYVLVYVKSKQDSINSFTRNTESFDLKRYKLKDEFFDTRGPYYLDNLDRGGLQYSDSMNFGIKRNGESFLFPNGRIKFENDGWTWKWGKEKVDWGFKHKFLEIKPSKKKSSGFGVYYKNYLKVDNECNPINRSAPLKNMLIQGVLNTDGTNDIQKLFDCSIFKNPKPVKYLKRLVNFVNIDNEIVLDFFAGSGTLAQAILELNSEGSKNTHFIAVQLPELINTKKILIYNFVKDELNENEPTIFHITKERIIRASKKIKEERPDYQGDLGFKIFETTPLFDGYGEDIKELDDKSPTLFDGSELSEDELQTLLTTYKVNDGEKLDTDTKEVTLDTYKAHIITDKLYLLNNGFTTDDLKALLEKFDNDKNFIPTRLIIFGYNFSSKHLREIQEATQGKNKKKLDIKIEVRY